MILRLELLVVFMMLRLELLVVFMILRLELLVVSMILRFELLVVFMILRFVEENSILCTSAPYMHQIRFEHFNLCKLKS